MRKPKNRFIGKCDWCGKELFAFGTPFVVQEKSIYKYLYCHVLDPEKDCISKKWAKDKKDLLSDGPGGLDQN